MSSIGRRRALRDRSLTQDELAQLRQEAIENLGTDARQTASDIYQGVGNFASFLKENPKSAVQLGALVSPDPVVGTAAGVAEAFGAYPDPFNPGENLPSVLEQLLEGEFLGAGLTTLGALPVVGAFASGVKNAKRISDAADADVLLEFEDLGGATVRLQPREDGTININELVSPERNKGNASEVLNRIHDKADEDGLSLVLTPERMQQYVDVPGTLDTDELVEFYRRKGYRVRFPDSDNPDQIPEMIRDPKVKPKPNAPPMTEKQYNTAIGAAKGNKELQQRLIAEKNEFFPKKQKPKSTKPTKTPRQKAAEASRTSVIPGIAERGDSSNVEVFGEGLPGLVKYSTPTTRAFANMERPKQNMSGDALLNRLDISAIDESQSGIRSLIDEMGGLDNPNFIGDKGALITFDEFFDRLVEYGPKRSTIQHTNPTYARLQEIKYTNDRSVLDKLPEGTDFALAPNSSRGLSNNYRFAVLHTNDPNISGVDDLPDGHRHYNETKEPVRNYLGQNTKVISHSRGGFYRMINSKNPNDKNHLVVALDEFQTDGFKKLSENRGLISPEKILRETKKIEERRTSFKNRADEINTKALTNFDGKQDEFVKDFNKLFKYRKFTNPLEGGVVNRIRMDRFIKDIRKDGTPLNEAAKAFFEKNPPKRTISRPGGLSSLFSRGTDIEPPSFDPSDDAFLRMFLTSEEGFQAFARNTDVPGYQFTRDIGDQDSFASVLRGYAGNPGNVAANQVIGSLSRLIAKKDMDGFIGRAALETEDLQALAEAGDQFDSLSRNLDDLKNADTNRSKIVDRTVAEQRRKYAPVIDELDRLDDRDSKFEAVLNKKISTRMDLVDEKIKERFDVFDSLRKIEGKQFEKNRAIQFKEIDSAVREADNIAKLPRVKRDVNNFLEAFKDNKGNIARSYSDIIDSDPSGTYTRPSGAAFNGDYGGLLEVDLNKGHDPTISIILEGDFTSSRGIQQIMTQRLDAPFDPSDQKNIEALESLQTIQDELRSLLGVNDYENFSQMLKADTLLEGETQTYKTLSEAKDKVKEERKEFIKKTEEQDPEFSEQLLKEIGPQYGDIADLPYKDAVDVQRQLVSENLGHLLGDGYVMNHAMPTTRVTADELLEAGGEHSVPKFIVLPSGYKTLQNRPESGATIDNPLGFKFMDPGRDKAVAQFIEDNPGAITIRDDLKNAATTQQVPEEVKFRKQHMTDEQMDDPEIDEKDKYEIVKPKDLVLEITPEHRRKLAESFARAFNDNYTKQLERAAARGEPVEEVIVGYNPSDQFEDIRGEAMGVLREVSEDAETFVRFAKGGEVNLRKGIGGMARKVL